MIPNMNLSQARREDIDAGGYIVRVIETNIDTKYNRLQLYLDIVDGPKAGYYTRLHERQKFWGLVANLKLAQDDAWKFANAVNAFRESNADFEWNDDAENDEHNMVGMYVGAVTQKYHYIGNDAGEKSKLVVYRLVPIEDIKSGNFEIPEDSYSKDFPREESAPGGVVDTTSGFGPISEDDMPF